jgi:hypothetical protein
VVQAGTAISNRGRGEINSFNVLHIERRRIQVQRFGWNQGERLFMSDRMQSFELGPEGWSLLAEE